MVQERSVRQRSSVRVAQTQEPQRGEVSLFHTLFEKDLLYFRFFVLEYPCVVCKIINYPQKIPIIHVPNTFMLLNFLFKKVIMQLTLIF